MKFILLDGKLARPGIAGQQITDKQKTSSNDDDEQTKKIYWHKIQLDYVISAGYSW